jgi:hypothetical protein
MRAELTRQLKGDEDVSEFLALLLRQFQSIQVIHVC